jgi:hypothetical protein
MDIFTTQLTRVVPVPIKPASLKVKALLKEAANTKLSQDPDHLENHEYYFSKEEDQYHSKQQEAVTEDPESNDDDKSVESGEKTPPKNNKSKHLDLYA